jgi:uncharacterized protein (DUF488 family)
LETRGGSDQTAGGVSTAGRSTVFTVGHGLISAERLIELLRGCGVDLVVDVRSQPYSSRAPQFNLEALKSMLERAGFEYEWQPALGGRPLDHPATESGLPDYERMALRLETRLALDTLASKAADENVVILCSESAPEQCHRSRMIEPELARRGVWVEHILHSGERVARPTLFA